MREARALLAGPALELGRILEVKAVEKRPRVEPDRRSQVARGDRRLELTSVARDHHRVQRKRSRADNDFLGPELAAERVDRLLERVARSLLVAFRPEVQQQLVTAEAGWPGGG